MKGFCEKAYKAERQWKGKDTYEAVIDGEKIGFFTDARILDYANKEVEFEKTVNGNFINGKLPQAEKKPFIGGGFKGKSDLEIWGTTLNTCIMKSADFAATLKFNNNNEAQQWLLDTMTLMVDKARKEFRVE